MTQSRRQLAFTAIELLVVMSILGVLAAIAAPILKSAKQKAILASTLTAVRGIHAAHSLYLPDYDGMIASAVDECEVRRTCSGVDPTWLSLLDRLRPPSFGTVLRPYGAVPQLFRVAAGAGPADYDRLGTNYRFPHYYLPRSAEPYESEGCVLFEEREAYLWYGGKLPSPVPPATRLVAVSFAGHARFMSRIELEEADVRCRLRGPL